MATLPDSDIPPGWQLQDGRIVKTYRFENYHQTIAFVNAIAWIAHRADHHPELAVGYNACRVEYFTHSTGGLSDKDLICAASVDALLS